KPATLRVYEKNLRLHVLPTLGHRKVAKLHRKMIKALLVQKLEEGHAREHVRLMHATLRAMLNAALDDGLLVGNPAEKLGKKLRLVKSKEAQREEIKALSREQLATFLDTARTKAPLHFPLFFTLARTGLRLGEARALQWGDVDLDQREMRIERTVVDESNTKLGTPKSGHARTVDLSRQAADLFRMLDRGRKAAALRDGSGGPWRWVFPAIEGGIRVADRMRPASKRVLPA